MGTGLQGKSYWRFLVLAVVAHGVLFVALGGRDGERGETPSLGGKFTKRRPLREAVLRRSVSVPQTRRVVHRSLVRPQAYARATMPQGQAPAVAQTVHALGSHQVVRPTHTPGVGVAGMGRTRSEPLPVAVGAEDEVDLGLELVDTEALDTGRYRALVVQERGNRRGLKGYVRLAAVAIRSALVAAENSETCRQNLIGLRVGSFSTPDWRHSANVRSLDELAVELEAQTDLKATVDQDAHLDESEWMETPFVLLTSAVDFEPTSLEVTQLGRYLVSGGFAYVEVVGGNSNLDMSRGLIADLESLRGLVTSALTGQGLQRGKDWDIEPLPMEHPLLSCYHEIKTMPRSYWSLWHEFMAKYTLDYYEKPQAWLGRPAPFLEAIYVRGRLAGIYSQQAYRDFWARRVERSRERPNWYNNRINSDAAARLGVNCVVYALTQEGSLARQLVSR